jgi:DNA-binding winged helix-turn-helix (wHTH) protein
MTITALPARPTHPRPTGLRHGVPNRRSTPDDKALTVTFEVTLSGDSRFLDAAEVLESLRRVTARLTTARVHVDPPLALTTAPEPGTEQVTVPSVPEALILSESREVRVGSRLIPFTRIEFDLLRFLAEHPRQVFTREQLLLQVWGFAHGGSRTVDVHIRRLRAKLDDRELMTTVRGVGYRLAEGANLRVIRLVETDRALPGDLARHWA